MPEQTYKIEYNFGRFEKSELAEKGNGGTDAFLFVSLIYPEDDSLSMAITSADGRTQKPLEDSELFKIWSMLGNQLSKSNSLDSLRINILKATFALIRRVVTGQEKSLKKGKKRHAKTTK